jgi:hypothetical protein
VTWRSMINEMPECDADHPDYPAGYDQWLEKVMDEPWVRALEGMVKWTGVWIGTEERFFEELRMRVGREVASSPDFPSSAERLELYQSIAIDGFRDLGLEFWRYSDLSEEDLDDFDAPAWGPEAPILLFNGDAARPLDYWSTRVKLLKYWHPVPLAVLGLAASGQFAKSRDFEKVRKRTYTTRELGKALVKHYPDQDNVPKGFADAARPEGGRRSPARLRDHGGVRRDVRTLRARGPPVLPQTDEEVGTRPEGRGQDQDIPAEARRFPGMSEGKVGIATRRPTGRYRPRDTRTGTYSGTRCGSPGVTICGANGGAQNSNTGRDEYGYLG